MVKVLSPELKEEELQKAVEPILQEYLEHGDSAEVAVRITVTSCVLFWQCIASQSLL